MAASVSDAPFYGQIGPDLNPDQPSGGITDLRTDKKGGSRRLSLPNRAPYSE
jgi:hypothetical protein